MLLSCAGQSMRPLPAFTQLDVWLQGFTKSLEDEALQDLILSDALEGELADQLWNTHKFRLIALGANSEKQRVAARNISWATGNGDIEDLQFPEVRQIARVWANLIFVGHPSNEVSVGILHQRTNGILVRTQVCIALPQPAETYCAIGEGISQSTAQSIVFSFDSSKQRPTGDVAVALKASIQNALQKLLASP